jgi:hypothetical protein
MTSFAIHCYHENLLMIMMKWRCWHQSISIQSSNCRESLHLVHETVTVHSGPHFNLSKSLMYCGIDHSGCQPARYGICIEILFCTCDKSERDGRWVIRRSRPTRRHIDSFIWFGNWFSLRLIAVVVREETFRLLIRRNAMALWFTVVGIAPWHSCETEWFSIHFHHKDCHFMMISRVIDHRRCFIDRWLALRSRSCRSWWTWWIEIGIHSVIDICHWRSFERLQYHGSYPFHSPTIYRGRKQCFPRTWMIIARVEFPTKNLR